MAALVMLTVACGAPTGSGGDGASGNGGGGGGGGAGTNDGGDDEESTTTTTRPPRHFTLAAAGDILLHNYVITDGRANAGGKGYNFDPMFDDVRDLISRADVSICHQETPISADNTQLTVPRTLSFNAPKEIATALKNAGFDGCDTASNHTWDRLFKGVKDTLDVLDAAGLKHAGASRSEQEADTPPIYEVNGVQVGHLAYSYTIYNNAGPNTQVPPEAPFLKAMLWPAVGVEGILAAARKLRARGAEVVVVSMHWGDQYISQPNAQQRQLAKDLLAAPEIDLILGDHVHVVQPCEKIGDKYVTYGLGNFLSNQSPDQDRTLTRDNQDGSLQTFTFDEVSPGTFRVSKMTYAPTYVITVGHKIVRATPETHPESYKRTVKAMNLLGPGTCDATPDY